MRCFTHHAARRETRRLHPTGTRNDRVFLGSGHQPVSCRVTILLSLPVLLMALRPTSADEAPPRETQRCDVLLTNGTIHPGDGSEPFRGSIAIRGDRIVSVSTTADFEADVRIDCSGLVVCPGFIDLHNHSDDPVLAPETRSCVNYLLQGCTTMVTGNCGMGPVNTGAYLAQLDEFGSGTNIAHLLPHGSLRSEVMGKVDRPATEDELKVMRELAAKAMLDGAFGMTTGLIYIPGTLTTTEELIEIAREIGRHRGLYASHIRGEGIELVQSVDEALRIGEASGCPVHISHFKASGREAWGTLRLAIDRIEQARAAGRTVTADQYPYTASSTSLEATLLPAWSREGGREALVTRLHDAASAAQIRDEVSRKLLKASRIQLASCDWNTSWIGLSLEELSELQQRPIVDLVLEIEQNGGASVINFGMHEDDLRSAMPLPWVATASDGGSKIPTASQPHPRSFGTFPRKIGRYAFEEAVLSPTAAIRSATGLPAEILGLTDRGLLKAGLAADLAVFDPTTFRDQATYEHPYRTPAGIRYVLVNGVFAVYEGQATGTLSGRALRKHVTAPLTESSP